MTYGEETMAFSFRGRGAEAEFLVIFLPFVGISASILTVACLFVCQADVDPAALSQSPTFSVLDSIVVANNNA